MIISLMNNSQNILSEYEDWYIVFVHISLFVVGLGLGLVITLLLSKSYRQGQIDALRGKIKYEKKENKNGELLWTEKQTNTKT